MVEDYYQRIHTHTILSCTSVLYHKKFKSTNFSLKIYHPVESIFCLMCLPWASGRDGTEGDGRERRGSHLGIPWTSVAANTGRSARAAHKRCLDALLGPTRLKLDLLVVAQTSKAGHLNCALCTWHASMFTFLNF